MHNHPGLTVVDTVAPFFEFIWLVLSWMISIYLSDPQLRNAVTFMVALMVVTLGWQYRYAALDAMLHPIRTVRYLLGLNRGFRSRYLAIIAGVAAIFFAVVFVNQFLIRRWDPGYSFRASRDDVFHALRHHTYDRLYAPGGVLRPLNTYPKGTHFTPSIGGTSGRD